MSSTEPTAGSETTAIDTTVRALAADLELLAGRQGQLRGRSAGRRRSSPGCSPRSSTSPGHRERFLSRAVAHLAGRAGIRQFLDIGTGLPTVDNTHEVAQRVAPDARIVYVDNDPLVLAHARALLIEGRPRVAPLHRRRPARPAQHPRPRPHETLDFDQPIALMLMNILGHVGDLDEARAIVTAADGRPAVGQLPGRSRTAPTSSTARPSTPRSRCGTRRAAALPPPQARADRHVLRGAGAAGAGCGVVLVVATGRVRAG